MATTFLLNGTNTTLDADPNMPLLWAIREVARLHGMLGSASSVVFVPFKRKVVAMRTPISGCQESSSREMYSSLNRFMMRHARQRR